MIGKKNQKDKQNKQDKKYKQTNQQPGKQMAKKPSNQSNKTYEYSPGEYDEDDYSTIIKQSLEEEGFFGNKNYNQDNFDYREQETVRQQKPQQTSKKDTASQNGTRQKGTTKQSTTMQGATKQRKSSNPLDNSQKPKEIKESKIKKRKKSKKSSSQGKAGESDENVQKSKEGTKRRGTNREILVVTYIFIGLFVMLLANFSYFLFADSKSVINNTYNKRQDLLAERVIRGQILGNNGEVLAQTIEDDKGNSKRVYPYKDLFVHVVGRFDKGKTGIELSENFNLLTSNANPIEKIFNELSEKKNVGDNIVTTLDVELQKVAYNALGNHKGSVVVLEPSTGKVLAMVSKPDYDPNQITSLWNDLVDDSDNNSALINRATQGLYPPGSTFKIVTALQYMREHSDYKKFKYTCKGSITIGDMKINCYNNKVHGTVNLETALAKSCNTAFAYIGTKLNKNSWLSTSESLLFNSELPLPFPYKKSSFTLNSSSEKTLAAQTAIGQGNTLISPMHNLLLVSAIANGGTLMKPYVVDHIENYVGNVVSKNMPSTFGNLMTAKEAQTLTNMMEEVVNDGTAYKLSSNRYQAAGKTGSAEFNSGKSSHAWFVGFAPSDNPKIAVSVIVEGAGTGSDYAVPIAKKIMDTYFNR
ncbi:Cell division protein FtsI/penicillin-binding protein 2 [Anaerosporobacter mobilis DSM 15930]|uniref:Cell division protein FtsI/penicillin-binding protein 2 n=1 Tax=Anaerosporobacter mobilis DSM 15930 TaxID=1120996 RepID=A0A1M7ES15_9FIRM|nr:Cell division protein FtsI/penicillin-binding protein 2 [Anaerosporobacter mobilis DSM 15930]